MAAIDAGAGRDLLSYAETGYVWTSNVRVELGGGTATATGGVGRFEDVTGGGADDYLEGDDGPNWISGGNGTNELVGRGGDDTLLGGDDDDTLKGGGDNDRLYGYGGTNTLIGGTGDDTYGWYSGYEPKDIITEVAGEGDDTMTFASVSTAIEVAVDATIQATYGTAVITATDAAGIDRVIGGNRADRFVLADAASFAGLLDGGGVQSFDFADMNILDYSAWTSPVTVDYTGQLDASFTAAVTGVGRRPLAAACDRRPQGRQPDRRRPAGLVRGE